MKKRNYAAPIIVAGVLLLYYFGIIALFIYIPGIHWWAKLLLCAIPLAISAVIIYVLVQRLKELNSGETDDLDRY